MTDAWLSDAACRGMDTNIWFPIQGGDLKGPRAICATCPVTDPCLEKALHDEPRPTGIWGGTTERQRRDMRTALGIRSRSGRQPVAVHGTASTYRLHLRNGESCDECRQGNAWRSAQNKARMRQKRGVAV